MKIDLVVIVFLPFVLLAWCQVPRWHRRFERRFTDLERKVLDESVEFRNEILSLIDRVEGFTDVYNASLAGVSDTVTGGVNNEAMTCAHGEKIETISAALAEGFADEKRYIRRMLLKFEKWAGIFQSEITTVTRNLEISLRDQLETVKRELENDLVSYGQLQKEMEKYDNNCVKKVETVEEGLKKDIADVSKRMEEEIQTEISKLRSSTDTDITSCVRETQLLKENMQSLTTKTGLLKAELLAEIREEMAQKYIRNCGSWVSFMNSCYFISTAKTTWQEARDKCLEMDGYLAEVDSGEEEDILKELTKDRSTLLWLGASDLDKEGLWLWNHSKNNLNIQYPTWKPRRDTRENCLLIATNWGLFVHLHAVSCSMTCMYICEK